MYLPTYQAADSLVDLIFDPFIIIPLEIFFFLYKHEFCNRGPKKRVVLVSDWSLEVRLRGDCSCKPKHDNAQKMLSVAFRFCVFIRRQFVETGVTLIFDLRTPKSDQFILEFKWIFVSNLVADNMKSTWDIKKSCGVVALWHFSLTAGLQIPQFPNTSW